MILDEPEKSLGNEYISNVIVPLIKEKARTGKKIFIATHDANIAVRTLPYNSVYRKHGINGYETFVGNPFLNNLVNIKDETNKNRLERNKYENLRRRRKCIWRKGANIWKPMRRL